MKKRKQELETLNEKMEKACPCKLKSFATQAVPGTGNPNAEVLFIGEAPGKNEDEQGLPFVGRSGKFLDEMLASIKLERDDVYITNIVKYRPPENRDPTKEEVEDCFPWLEAQLEFIQPRLIVTLGRHALNRFLPKLKISEAHGKLVHANTGSFGEQYYYPLYHPAVALYGGKSRDFLLEDFAKIPKALQERKGEKK